MKEEKEIRQNKENIEQSGLELDQYMKGYHAALRWVLDELCVCGEALTE